MKALRISAMVVALSALALPAHAAVVGLLGGDFDPPPIDDPSIFGAVPCNGGDAVHNVGIPRFDSFVCVFYSFPFPSLTPISSIEFNLFGLDTEGLTVDNGDGNPFYLQNLSAGTIGSFRLDGGTIFPNFCNPEDEGCVPVTALALFIGPSGDEILPSNIFGQVVAVNTPVNIPEPTTLLLLGPGIAGAIVARRRMRRNPKA